MLFVLPLQLVVSAIYYITAPFPLGLFVVLFWLLNALSVILLIKNRHGLSGQLSPGLKKLRLLFTVTLVILEIIINLISEPYAADNFHGFISDVEVLVTGITLGLLWHYELTQDSKRDS
jgi:hypothetical protein